MIENVEKLSAELNVQIFMRRERVKTLEQPHIHVPVRGTAECVLADVAKRSDRRLGEHRNIEPGNASLSSGTWSARTRRWGATILGRSADEVYAIAAKIRFGLIRSRDKRKRVACRRGKDAVPLPSPEGPAERRVCVRQAGQVPDVGSHEDVRVIEVRRPGIE